IQGYIDSVASLASDLADASGLARDPDVGAYHLQSIVTDAVPQAIEALSHAQAIAAQYQMTQAKSAKPEGLVAHRLFAMTDRAARHLAAVERSLERMRSATAQGAAG